MTCEHAASGCNSPEGECLGVCQNLTAARLERAYKGEVVKEVWLNGHGLEIVFSDGSSLLIAPPFAFKPAPAAKSGEVE